MKILKWDDKESASRIEGKQYAVSIGVFDGLHTGHMELVKKICNREDGLESMVCTFTKSPRLLVQQAKPRGSLFTLRQKTGILDETGVDAMLLIDFSTEFSKIDGKDFIRILADQYGVRLFVVGSNFSCGYRQSTRAAELPAIASSLGASAIVVPPLLYDGLPVSSSRIKDAIRNGRMDLAFAMLGRPYTIDLEAGKISRKDGAITVSFDLDETILPKAGQYIIKTGYKMADAYIDRTGNIIWEDSGSDLPQFIEFMEK